MPHALGDVVRSWPGTSLGGVASRKVIPLLGLEIPDGAREEAGGDKIEEACGDDEEDLHLG